MLVRRFLAILGWVGVLGTAGLAEAGVYNVPHFVAPGQSAVGLESELTLTNGAGIGGSLRYTHGISDIVNVQGILGTGSGPRKFRVGGNMTFDFFPDVPGQPGIGVSAQALYVRQVEAGRLEMTATPYIHKTFIGPGGEFEPFFAIPFGMDFHRGNYRAISSISLGSLFKATAHLRYVLEVGIAVNNTESFIGGGIVYYP